MRRRRATRFFALAALNAVLVVTSDRHDASAQQRFYQPDERVLVTDGGMLYAIAVAPLEVFAASDQAILVRDIVRDRWQLPIPLPPGPAGTRPTALAWDAAGGTLWLGTDAGDVFTAVPGIGRWDQISIMARGRVDALVASPRDAAVYANIAGNWFRISAGSFFAEIITGGSLPAGVARAGTTPDDPYFRAARGTLGIDAQGRRWPVTAVAQGRETGEFWVATGGGGLIRYDGITNRQEWLRYGTVGRGVASVARIGDDLWFGGNGEPASGVSRSTASLAQWHQFDRGDGAPAGFVAEIVDFAGAIWFAASDGVFRLVRAETERATGRGDWSRLGTPDGLPTDRVRSLAVAWGLLWAGTDRGLTAFDSSGAAARSALFPGQRVSRLSFRNDTLWIATDRGLWRLAAASANSAARAEPVPANAAPALRTRVNDVLVSNDLSIAIADGLVYDINGPPAPLRDAMLDRIGPALRLAGRDGWLWVAGQRGVAYRDPETRTWQALTVPADVPAGPVLDLMPDGDDVWLATPAGAIRLRWR